MLFKKILALVFVVTAFSKISLAQKMEDYTSNWKKVNALDKKGLTSSALKEVVSIFNMAVASGNDAQQIKAAMYQMKYRNMVEEDNSEKNIFYIDTLIAKTKAPAKNILQSMQASLYWSYRQNNRYKFYGRTQLAKETSNDITTWSIEKLNTTITALYKASLKDELILKNTSLNGLDAIIQKGQDTRQLRPTLYDFLAHSALNYFMDDENNITQPAFKFILNDEKLFAPAPVFIHFDFKTKDTTSQYYNALLLLQDILKFHLTDANADALIDADLARLAFVNEHGVFTNKDKLYEDALKNIEAAHSNNPSVAQAMFLRASIYKGNGEKYNPITQKEVQFELKKAKELCEQAISRFPGSYGALNCQNLIAEIKTPALSLQTEKINIPDAPFRSLLKYKNITSLYLRVIKTNRDQLKLIEKNEYDKLWQAMTDLKALKSWSIALPDQQDYQEHSTEIKTDGLASGTYIILASINPDFSISDNIIARQITYVSNISFITNTNNDLYVLNRDNGQPIPNTELQLWQQEYNYTSRNYEQTKKEKYISDKNGHIKINKHQDNNYYYFQLKYKEDELFTDDPYYHYNYNAYENPNNKNTFLFTDRSIYRPGQTVFFKGIVISRESGGVKSSIVSNYKTTIALYDANNQKAASMQVISNEYGSYNGSFKLPENGLNGQFSLRDSADNSMQYFSVEEYKRAKFFVEVKKPEGTYRVNDSIQVIGTAKAYAGNNIDGAKVTYRVVRKVQYPVWWGWGGYRKIWPPTGSREEMEITNGETTTNANGTFFISFKAIPDETIEKKSQPIFYYEVSSDVTDINGETRSGNTSVAVSYQALQLDILAADKMSTDSFKNIKISSTNMNGVFEKATVNLIVQKLQSPNRIFRERFWEMPDQFIMTKEEYSKNFPYDVYADENEVSKWPVQQKVFDINDTTSKNSQFQIPNSKFNGGWYKLIAITKDKYGEEVRSEKYIRLTNDQEPVIEEPIIVDIKNNQVEPGQKINYSIATGFEKIWLIHSLNKIDTTSNTIYPTITNTNRFSNEINVTGNDRGGMNMSYAFVQHNRVYSGNEYFSVPWSNKDLHISYETFRDKILPGSEEKWKIKITGNKSEKFAAETLISMYDASLDQFKPHGWQSLKSIWPIYNASIIWETKSFVVVNAEERNNINNHWAQLPERSYDDLLDNGWREHSYFIRGKAFLQGKVAGVVVSQNSDQALAMAAPANEEVRHAKFPRPANKNLDAEELMNIEDTTKVGTPAQQNSANNQNPNVQVRKNFNETAFFFPALNTDSNGNIEFSFTIPEALTTWKLMTLAHSKDLASSYAEKTVITQKPLMIQPNAPRFLREGDQIEFSAKVVNLSDSEISGTAQLELFDAATNKPVDGLFKNIASVQNFTTAAGQSVAVKFPVDIPLDFNSALTWRIKGISKNGSFSDGEEAALPILTNRMLVTETMPLNMRNETTKNFKFEKLLNSKNSSSLTNHSLTVEYTSNPAWYAVQALPYLMEFPYECAEQNFNRYYANTLASFVSNSMPKIRAVFEKWKTADTAALLSNLQKNEELKSALLQETPWVLEAQSESAQKKNIAILFDIVRLAKEKDNSLNKLKEMQTGNGGFSWFKGGPDDRYITQYILTGIGHLQKLNALNIDDLSKLKSIIEKALPYLDARLKEEYDNLKKYKANLKANNLSYTAVQYLYMHSFFAEYTITNNAQTAYKYYYNQSRQYWLRNSKYMQAMIALSLHRTGDEKTPLSIIRSLKENAIYKEEMGMYFKEFTNGGYYWYQAPIESQALMIEAFTDIDKNNTTIDDLKTWLLKQKQTQNWKTTKATADACYALLLNGSNWLSEEKEITINVGNTVIKSTDEKNEAGTGYFKKTVAGDKVQQGMGNITVSINASSNQQISKSTSWGAVYWQYFEDLDKITSAETPLKLVKKLFIEKNSDHGPVLQALNDGDKLQVGDKIKVRIELKTDRDMEYIHMKDMRAACMEPVNVISEYKWQGGLGYYETTKDASTNFFFNWLPRGTYVFEYPMFVAHTGNFSNGITTIQCMYAPEFTSHSEGIRVNVADK